MSIDVMIDLETLGTATNSIILTFAAVPFVPSSGKVVGNIFYEHIDIDSYQAYLPWFSFSGSTMTWWMSQSDEARKEAFGGERKDIKAVMQKFYDWCGTISANGSKKIKLWSHGASFDIPIVTWTLRYFGLDEPWKFWDIRDTRTLFDLASLNFNFIPPPAGVPDGTPLRGTPEGPLKGTADGTPLRGTCGALKGTCGALKGTGGAHPSTPEGPFYLHHALGDCYRQIEGIRRALVTLKLTMS